MVAPERSPLAGLVEIDETTMRHRTAGDPPAGGRGRSHDAKLLIAGAVEIRDEGPLAGPGRIRLAAIDDFSAASLHRFMAANIAPDSTAKTDDWPGYRGPPPPPPRDHP